MFDLHDFVLKTVLEMIGNVHEYQVRDYSLGWYTKQVLVDEDMIKIEEALQPKEESKETVEEVVEETVEEVQATEENIEEVQ